MAQSCRQMEKIRVLFVSLINRQRLQAVLEKLDSLSQPVDLWARPPQTSDTTQASKAIGKG